MKNSPDWVSNVINTTPSWLRLFSGESGDTFLFHFRLAIMIDAQ